MKKSILISMLIWFFPVTVFALECNSAGGGTNAMTAITMLDNNTHNNCVNGDKVAWAIDKIYFYTDVYCTEGKQTLTFLGDVTPGESDKEDYAGSPTLGSGSISHGIYKCMAVRIWDNVTFSPSETTTSGGCAAGSDYTQDLCGGDNSSVLTQVWNPDTGAQYSCTVDSAPANEWIWVYLSTASTDLDADDNCRDCDWNPPTSDNLSKGVTLGAALVVSAAKTSTFKTTISNRIADTTVWGASGYCDMLKPAFTFE